MMLIQVVLRNLLVRTALKFSFECLDFVDRQSYNTIHKPMSDSGGESVLI